MFMKWDGTRVDRVVFALAIGVLTCCETSDEQKPAPSSFVGGYGSELCQGANCGDSPDSQFQFFDVVPPNGASDAGDVAAKADTNVVADDGGSNVDSSVPTGEDTGEDTAGPQVGSLGAACKIASDCVEDLDCVDWKSDQGMCTVVGCGAGLSCPPGSLCTGFGAQIQGCSPFCESAGDCPPGYGCKAVFMPDGGFKRICHAVETGASGPAGTCKSHVECKGDATCVLQLPGGYCGNVGCDAANPCPVGTHCVGVENVGNMCLAACDAAKICPGVAVKLQVCAEMQDIVGKTVTVCAAGQTGKDIGDFCSQNNQCASGECKITANGKCVEGGNGCNSDDDCYVGSCDLKPEYVVGTCVITCNAEKPCPPDTVCVPTSANQGVCRLACKSLSDVFTCDDQAGEACVFGIPLTDKDGTGAYACAAVSSGGMGTSCDPQSGQGCGDGYMCLAGTGKNGMCVTSCGGKTPAGVDFCPWTGLCFSTGATTQCQKLCPKNKPLVECPVGFGCKSFTFSSPFPNKPVLVCVPE